MSNTKAEYGPDTDHPNDEMPTQEAASGPEEETAPDPDRLVTKEYWVPSSLLHFTRGNRDSLQNVLMEGRIAAEWLDKTGENCGEEGSTERLCYDYRRSIVKAASHVISIIADKAEE